MIVVVNGMPRSGSTFAFNIAREILMRNGMLKVDGGATASDIIKKLHDYHTIPTTSTPVITDDVVREGVELYKCHYFIPPTCPYCNRKVKLIYTYRNPLGALASSIRVKREVFEKMGYDLFIGGLEYDYSHWCAMMWAFCTSLTSHQKIAQRYEDFMRDPFYALAYPITQLLDIKVDDFELHEIIRLFSPKKMREVSESVTPGSVDVETHLRYNHISEDLGNPDSWRTVLPAEIVERVKTQFASWMRECFWNA